MRKRNKRVTISRISAIVAVVGLTLAALGLPAGADAAKSGTATAYGLEATGLIPIAKTPEVSVTSPPDDLKKRSATINVPAAALAIAAAVTAEAESHFNDGVDPYIIPSRPATVVKNPITLTDVNTRAYASAANVDVLVTPTGVDCNTTPALCLSAVNANAIESEAVAKCVNNQPVFDTGYARVGLDVLGITVGQILDPVLSLVLGLLAPGQPLAIIASVEEGHVDEIRDAAGQQIGVSIDALRVKVLGNVETLTVGHSEVRMTRDCAPPAAAKPAALAVTGGGNAISILGASLVMAAVLMLVMTRKSQTQE